MIQQLGGEKFLMGFPKDRDFFQQMTDFYDRNGTLPLSAGKSIISLFRKIMIYDTSIEEIQVI